MPHFASECQENILPHWPSAKVLFTAIVKLRRHISMNRLAQLCFSGNHENTSRVKKDGHRLMNPIIRRMGQGKLIKHGLRISLRAMMLAACCALIKNGMGNWL